MDVVNVDVLGKTQKDEARNSVIETSRNKVVSRAVKLAEQLKRPDDLRYIAADLRQHTLDHLDYYLPLAEKNLQKNGIQVHWAATGDEACRIVSDICRKAGAKTITKSKSMVTEEIELNKHLESEGFQPVETDLGEFVVQLDGDHPTHIVTPIIHKSKKDVAKTFAREGLCEYTEDETIMANKARVHLRKMFRKSIVGITGANFVVAQSGRFLTVTNEGNARFGASAPKTHIGITGIEKVVARENDLAVLLKLLARSSTSQDITVYTNFIAGPKRPGDPDGPEEVHLVFLDNGRSRIVGSRYHEMLRCIRCGACLNVCPVYRQVTGHAYKSVYPGPMGKVFSPLLGPNEQASRKKYAYLPKSSSLCAACEEVCPVAIPIPKMLLALRSDLKNDAPKIKGAPPFGIWSIMATNPFLWKMSLSVGKMLNWTGVQWDPSKGFPNWLKYRDLPAWPNKSFRQWWKKRGSH